MPYLDGRDISIIIFKAYEKKKSDVGIFRRSESYSRYRLEMNDCTRWLISPSSGNHSA